MQVDTWYFLIISKHQCTAQTVIRNIWLWRLIMRGQWIMNEDTTHVKPAMSLFAIQVYNKWIWWQTGKIHWVHYNKTQTSRHLKQPSIITESVRAQCTLQSTQVLYRNFFQTGVMNAICRNKHKKPPAHYTADYILNPGSHKQDGWNKLGNNTKQITWSTHKRNLPFSGGNRATTMRNRKFTQGVIRCHDCAILKSREHTFYNLFYILRII
jgi:hypothetical protein